MSEQPDDLFVGDVWDEETGAVIGHSFGELVDGEWRLAIHLGNAKAAPPPSEEDDEA